MTVVKFLIFRMEGAGSELRTDVRRSIPVAVEKNMFSALISKSELAIARR